MNELFAIKPYQWNGLWVFDDPERGLLRESLIAGADTVLEAGTAHIPNRENGIVCVFASGPFPGHTISLRLVGPDDKMFGHNYWCEQFQVTAWLCPALLRYFPKAPRNLYVMFRAIQPNQPKGRNHEQERKNTH